MTQKQAEKLNSSSIPFTRPGRSTARRDPSAAGLPACLPACGALPTRRRARPRPPWPGPARPADGDPRGKEWNLDRRTHDPPPPPWRWRGATSRARGEGEAGRADSAASPEGDYLTCRCGEFISLCLRNGLCCGSHCLGKKPGCKVSETKVE